MANSFTLYLKTKLRNTLLKHRFLRRFNHDINSFKVKGKRVGSSPHEFDDMALIARLKKFYINCDAHFDGNRESMWSEFFDRLHGEIHAAFKSGTDERIRDILRHPRRYNLFYGFENLSRDLIALRRLDDIYEPELTMDSLVSLAEVAGVLRMSNPEANRSRGEGIGTTNQILHRLDMFFGFAIEIPNPFEGEYGIETERGILSYRAVQALYQAWRISQIVRAIPNAKVLEIGGGLGRTAFYCRQFGVTDYTIVDIPISSLAQGDFLGRVMPESDLWMAGEGEPGAAQVKLVYPASFLASSERYDLIVNFDSLSELDIEIARDYVRHIAAVGSSFLSINHENNKFTVNALAQDIPELMKRRRDACWVRRGYAEELYEQAPLTPAHR